MICALCIRSFDPDNQSPVCPHEILDYPVSKPGGFKLRPDLKRQIDDAFGLRNKETLRDLARNSLNFAVRFYANHMLKRLEEQEKMENVSSLSQLQE